MNANENESEMQTISNLYEVIIQCMELINMLIAAHLTADE